MKKDKDVIHFKWSWKVFWGIVVVFLVFAFFVNYLQNANNGASQSSNNLNPQPDLNNSNSQPVNSGVNLVPSNYNFSLIIDPAPYYGGYCDKIDPYNLNVREASSLAIKNDPGSYNINQLLDIYDWTKNNIQYQNVPLSGIPYPPSQTLYTSSGDCKNQAVLIASMVESIGGTAKVVVDPSCAHAYALVYASNQSQDMQGIADTISKHYNQQLIIHWITLGNQNWLIFDPAGGNYPGNTLPECSGIGTNYYIDSCLSCAQQYPNSPYTFNGECYSQCPSGTISVNNNACSPCPQGSYSYNNKCVTCQSGYSLHTDGNCYPS